MCAGRCSPYASSSKGKSKGKDNKGKVGKHTDRRVTAEDLVTYERVFKGKGSSTSSSSSQGTSSSKGSKGYVRPDFTSLGGKGEVLRELWDIAEDKHDEEDRDFHPELEDSRTKNTLARASSIIQKRRTRMARAIELVKQFGHMEREYVREWQRSNDRSANPPQLVPIFEAIPAEFWTLL